MEVSSRFARVVTKNHFSKNTTNLSGSIVEVEEYQYSLTNTRYLYMLFIFNDKLAIKHR